MQSTTADTHACCIPLGERGPETSLRRIRSINLETSCTSEQEPLEGREGARGSSSEVPGLPSAHSTVFEHAPRASHSGPWDAGVIRTAWDPSLEAHGPLGGIDSSFCQG